MKTRCVFLEEDVPRRDDRDVMTTSNITKASEAGPIGKTPHDELDSSNDEVYPSESRSDELEKNKRCRMLLYEEGERHKTTDHTLKKDPEVGGLRGRSPPKMAPPLLLDSR